MGRSDGSMNARAGLPADEVATTEQSSDRPIDAVRVMAIGTVVWAVAFVALLPFTGRLADAGRSWWLWTCLAGVGLGLLGWEFCRWHRSRAGSPAR